jgi:LysM repeat protein
MVARNRLRYLAPIALAATITATYFVVRGALSDTRSSSHSHVVGNTSRARRGLARARFYVVKRGDTLSEISSRSGIPVPTLQILNPNLNPNALRAGQRLRLRR